MPSRDPVKPSPKSGYTTIAGRKLSKGQLAYEQERARQAGKSLEDWMKAKIRSETVEPQKVVKPTKKPGFFARLIDKAHKPL